MYFIRRKIMKNANANEENLAEGVIDLLIEELITCKLEYDLCEARDCRKQLSMKCKDCIKQYFFDREKRR